MQVRTLSAPAKKTAPAGGVTKQKQSKTFEQKVREVEALLPQFVGTREERRSFDNGIGYIRHNAKDFSKFIAGVTRLLDERGNTEELAAFVTNPLRSGLDYTYADAHKPEDILLGNFFARLSSFESVTSPRTGVEIREWTAPWCMNPGQNSRRVCMPLENLSNVGETLPVTFGKNTSTGWEQGATQVMYGKQGCLTGFSYWQRDQGQEFLTALGRSKGADVFISLSYLNLDGVAGSVGQGKLSFRDKNGIVNIFEFNGGELTARKAEKYILAAGGTPVYGTIQIVPEKGSTQTWYGTIGIDATRREAESWLKFVKSRGEKECKITLIGEAGRAEAPVLIAESDNQTHCIQLTTQSGLNRILGNLDLYSYQITKLSKGQALELATSVGPESLVSNRTQEELYPKVGQR